MHCLALEALSVAIDYIADSPWPFMARGRDIYTLSCAARRLAMALCEKRNVLQTLCNGLRMSKYPVLILHLPSVATCLTSPLALRATSRIANYLTTRNLDTDCFALTISTRISGHIFSYLEPQELLPLRPVASNFLGHVDFQLFYVLINDDMMMRSPVLHR